MGQKWAFFAREIYKLGVKNRGIFLRFFYKFLQKTRFFVFSKCKKCHFFDTQNGSGEILQNFAYSRAAENCHFWHFLPKMAIFGGVPRYPPPSRLLRKMDPFLALCTVRFPLFRDFGTFCSKMGVKSLKNGHFYSEVFLLKFRWGRFFAFFVIFADFFGRYFRGFPIKFWPFLLLWERGSKGVPKMGFA
jgi:hypothetical protein